MTKRRLRIPFDASGFICDNRFQRSGLLRILRRFPRNSPDDLALTDKIDPGKLPETPAGLPHPKATRFPVEDLDDSERDFKVWTRDEANSLRLSSPSVSPWRVVAVQAAVGVVCSVIAACFGSVWVAWSAMYGAVAVVLPGALMARGMTRKAVSPLSLAAGFMFWEMLKVGAAIAMLVIAARVVPNLSWPALLVTMVVCMKVNWFALLWRGRQ